MQLCLNPTYRNTTIFNLVQFSMNFIWILLAFKFELQFLIFFATSIQIQFQIAAFEFKWHSNLNSEHYTTQIKYSYLLKHITLSLIAVIS